MIGSWMLAGKTGEQFATIAEDLKLWANREKRKAGQQVRPFSHVCAPENKVRDNDTTISFAAFPTSHQFWGQRAALYAVLQAVLRSRSGLTRQATAPSKERFQPLFPG